MKLSDDQRKTIKRFLKKKKILIVDPHLESRSVLRKSFLQLGAIKDNLLIHKNYAQAFQQLNEEKPEIVVSEFQISNHFGLDLAQLHSELITDFTKKIFFITSNHPTKEAVVDAADEQVDAFLVKPVSIKTVKRYLSRVILRKLNPTEYQKLIFDIKNSIRSGDLTKAKKLCTKAKFLVQEPCMVYYYLGLIAENRGLYKEALENYQRGLNMDSDHFNCLSGRATTQSQQSGPEQLAAMDALAKSFPLTPKLLKSALQVSIEKFDSQHVNEYFNAYMKHTRQSDEVRKFLSQLFLKSALTLMEKPNDLMSIDFLIKGILLSPETEYFVSQLTVSCGQKGHQSFFRKFVAKASRELPDDILSPAVYQKLTSLIDDSSASTTV